MRTISPASRLIWIDSFRGLAVLWMIQTHCFNTFLDPTYRDSNWFASWNFSNGLVAPAFLFIAGFVQGLANRRSWQNPKPLAPRLRRLFVILLLGYALQFPWGSLLGWTPDLGDKILASLCRVDVLHCLAVSLAMLLAIARLSKSARNHDITCLILTVIFVTVSPFVWQWQPSPLLPSSLVSWINPAYGALFPIFPWFAFVSVGALFSRYMDQKNFFLGCCLIAWAAAFTITSTMAHSPSAFDYITRPYFFLQRIGWLLLIAYCLMSLPRIASTRLLIFSGSRSLTLYVLHLQIIYGGLGMYPSLSLLLHKNQPTWSVALLTLAVCSLSLFLTWCMVLIAGSASYQSLLSRYENRHRI